VNKAIVLYKAIRLQFVQHLYCASIVILPELTFNSEPLHVLVHLVQVLGAGLGPIL